jgi:hypothetical protein
MNSSTADKFTVSYKLFDEISREAELSSELSFVFCFYFERRMPFDSVFPTLIQKKCCLLST